MVSSCSQTVEIEMYALPESDGTVALRAPRLADTQTIAITDSFILAVLCPSVEETLEAPIVVANVDQKYWIRHE
jgi:hypothetical protein